MRKLGGFPHPVTLSVLSTKDTELFTREMHSDGFLPVLNSSELLAKLNVLPGFALCAFFSTLAPKGKDKAFRQRPGASPVPPRPGACHARVLFLCKGPASAEHVTPKRLRLASLKRALGPRPRAPRCKATATLGHSKGNPGPAAIASHPPRSPESPYDAPCPRESLRYRSQLHHLAATPLGSLGKGKE